MKISKGLFDGYPNSKILVKLIRQPKIYSVTEGTCGRKKPGAKYFLGFFDENLLTIRSHPDFGVEIKLFGELGYPIAITNNSNVICSDESKLPVGFLAFLKSKFLR